MKFMAIGLAIALSLAGCNVSFNSGNDSNLPETSSGSQSQQTEAEAAARSYLAMIDQKQYEKTWEQAGPALRSQSSEFAWVNMLKLARKTFTAITNRQVEGFGFSSQIDPNVPVGEYVLVQFKEVKGNVTTTEKVVMQKDQGKWKIVGYFIHKFSKFGSGT